MLGSTFGAVMLVRLGVICAAAFLLRPLLRGEGGESKADLALLGVLGVAALATWPLTGHPTASPVAGVSVVVDAIHLAAMSVWLGGLVMLVGVPAAPGQRARAGRDPADLVALGGDRGGRADAGRGRCRR